MLSTTHPATAGDCRDAADGAVVSDLADPRSSYINSTLRDVWVDMDRTCQRLRLLSRSDVDPQELYLMHGSAIALIKAINAFYGRRVVGLPCLTASGTLLVHPGGVRVEPLPT
jgi:hypothetical protein